MTSIKVISEKPIAMAEVKENLASIQKKGGELNFRANKTFDYLQEFGGPSVAKVRDLIAKIEGLNIPRLKEEHIIKIVDTLPKYPEEVKALLSGYTLTITNDNAKKIADVVSSSA
ncbi:MAG: hypothetical protein ACMXYE_04695 [Candidatus Woesearchaeota archaeon]